MKKVLFFFIVLLVVTSSICGFLLLPKKSLKNPPLIQNYFLKPEDITKKQLENGLVVIVKQASRSGLVSIGVFVRVGSCSEGRFQGSGISHLVEHMIFKGAPGTRRADLEKEIKLYGGMINGATSSDFTSYTILIPSEHFDKAVEILKDAITNPFFDNKELEKEKLVILKEILMNKDDPLRHLHDLFDLTAYKVHPYKYATIGYEELLLKIKRQDLIEFHKTHYTPDNMVVVVVGDVDAKLSLKKFRMNLEDFRGPLSYRHSYPRNHPRYQLERRFKNSLSRRQS